MSLSSAYINGFVKRASEYGFNMREIFSLLKKAEDTLGSTLYGTVGKGALNIAENVGTWSLKNLDKIRSGAHKTYETSKPYIGATDDFINKNNIKITPRFNYHTFQNIKNTAGNAAENFENIGHKLDEPLKPTINTVQQTLNKGVNLAENIPQPFKQINADPMQQAVGKKITQTVAYPALRTAADMFVPGAGGVVSAAHAGERMARGDNVGAWIDRASGLANAVSVYPPAYPIAKPLSLGLNVVNFARDMHEIGKPIAEKLEPLKDYIVEDSRNFIKNKRISDLRNKYQGVQGIQG